MNTVSVDYAKKLKAAGLEHVYRDENNNDMFIDIGEERNLWLPTLSDLLREIEARGVGYIFGCTRGRLKHWIALLPPNLADHKIYYADTPEDAAAEALLWILEGGE